MIDFKCKDNKCGKCRSRDFIYNQYHEMCDYCCYNCEDAILKKCPSVCNKVINHYTNDWKEVMNFAKDENYRRFPIGTKLIIRSNKLDYYYRSQHFNCDSIKCDYKMKRCNNREAIIIGYHYIINHFDECHYDGYILDINTDIIWVESMFDKYMLPESLVQHNKFIKQVKIEENKRIHEYNKECKKKYEKSNNSYVSTDLFDNLDIAFDFFLYK